MSESNRHTAFRCPNSIHKALQRWSLQYHRSYSRLIRALLTLTPWNQSGIVTYTIGVPAREHKDTETLKAALDTAVKAIIQEWEDSDNRFTSVRDKEGWGNDKPLSGRVDIKPPPSPDNANEG